jgi:hypothetical protein
MAPVYLAKCANCGMGTSMRCVRCMDAPEYEPGDSVDSVYCDRECQKEHWPNHKAHCHALGQRKKLLRTVKILKAALLTYREVIYDVDLTKIELRDGVLCLHHGSSDWDFSASSTRKRNLVKKPERLLASIATICCSAVAFLASLI